MGAFFITSIFPFLFVYLVKFGWNERQDELVSGKKGHEQEKVWTKTQPNGTFSFYKLVQVNA